MNENETGITEEAKEQPAAETALATQTKQPGTLTIWNDDALMRKAWKAAQFLSSSDLVPDTYKHKPENCLIALDMANRTAMSPMIVMQNLYIVKGKPAWSGSFCAAAINGCGKFTPLEYVWSEDGTGCMARAKRISSGQICQSENITMQMAKDEGWLDKAGSKWKTMPHQMMMYRSASFFARTFCPEVLLGIQTVEEVQDVNGYEDTDKNTVVITLDGKE